MHFLVVFRLLPMDIYCANCIWFTLEKVFYYRSLKIGGLFRATALYNSGVIVLEKNTDLKISSSVTVLVMTVLSLKKSPCMLLIPEN